MCVAVRLVLEVLTHVAHAFYCGIGQGVEAGHQGEPTHVEAFLVTYERFGITIRIGLAHEQVIHIHGVVAIRVGQHLGEDFTDTKSVTITSMPVSSLTSRATVSAGSSPGSLMPYTMAHSPVSERLPKQHTTLLVFNIAGDAHQPQEIVTDFLA